MKKFKVGIIGCGMISDIYLKNITSVFSDVLEAYACADLILEKSKARAEKYGCKALSIDEIFNDINIDIILNLTVPNAHYGINKRALISGKHVYCEKPLADSVQEAKELVDLAKLKDLYIGCAPDTFMGGGLQTCRKLIDEGAIGEPVSINAVLISSGPESFHPNPEFFYQKGAGPLLDMGPYYITAMVSLFGPVKKVAGISKSSYGERTITGKVRTGEKFKSEVDTYISAILHFENGVIANLIVSWDMQYPYWESKLPLLQVFGSKGSMILPDPNTFGGISKSLFGEIGKNIKIRTGAGEFEERAVSTDFIENSRGIGLAEMAYSIAHKKGSRASGQLALHVLEVMLGILESSKDEKFIEIENKCGKPEPVGPAGKDFFA